MSKSIKKIDMIQAKANKNVAFNILCYGLNFETREALADAKEY